MRSAQAWFPPAVTAFALPTTPVRVTSTLPVAEGAPVSWLCPLAPKHLRVAEPVSSPQAWARPVATRPGANPPPSEGAIGVSCVAGGGGEVVTCPSPFSPQQRRSGGEPAMAQEKARPAATKEAGEAPETGRGRLLCVVEPSPSCPDPFAPQQASPPAPTAQVCRSPAASAEAPVTPVTGRGVLLCAVDPSPSCPDPFAPQQVSPPAPIAQVWPKGATGEPPAPPPAAMGGGPEGEAGVATPATPVT